MDVFMVIDAHMHLLASDGYAKSIVNTMDLLDIEYSLILGLSPEFTFLGQRCCGNDEVLKAVKEFPDRLIGGVSIDPRRPDAIDTLHCYADQGFKAAKFFPPIGFYMDEPQFFPLYAQIEKLGWPVTVHCGLTNIPYTGSIYKTTHSKYSDPIRLDSVVRHFPKINWIIAHMGWPHFETVWGQVQFNQNVYMDISGPHAQTNGLDKIQREGFGFTCGVNLFEKMLWGSDCIDTQYYFSRTQHKLTVMGHKEQIPAIFGKTASRLLGLSC
jgi:predicted TIM-barrel fold metal-dependent hydrolase